MAGTRSTRGGERRAAFVLWGLAACLLCAPLGCGGGGGNTEVVTVTGTVAPIVVDTAPPVVASSTWVGTLNRDFIVVAVNEAGEVIGSDTAANDQFSLSLPTGHDYVIAFRVSTPNGATLAVLTVADGAGRAVFDLSQYAPETVDLGQVTFAWPRLSMDDGAGGILVTATSDRSLATFFDHPGGSVSYPDHDGDLIPDAMDRDDDNDGIDDAHDVAPRTYQPYNIDFVACPTAQAHGALTVSDRSAFIATALDVGMRNTLFMQAAFDQLGMTALSSFIDSFGSSSSSGSFSDVVVGPPTNAELDQLLVNTQSLPVDLEHYGSYSVSQLTRGMAAVLRTFASLSGYTDGTEFQELTSAPNYQIPRRLNDGGCGQFGSDTLCSAGDTQVIEYYRSIARVLRSFGIRSIDDPDDPATAEIATRQIQDFLDPGSYATPEELLNAYGALLDELDYCAAYSETPSRWAGIMTVSAGQ